MCEARCGRRRVKKYARCHEYLVSDEKWVEDAEERQFVLILRKTNLRSVSANNQRNER